MQVPLGNGNGKLTPPGLVPGFFIWGPMADIIYLDEHRPHITGHAVCHECGREWTAVVDARCTTELECPSCRAMAGALTTAS